MTSDASMILPTLEAYNGWQTGPTSPARERTVDVDMAWADLGIAVDLVDGDDGSVSVP